MKVYRASASAVRAAIVRAWLGPGDESELGDVRLRAHQRDAAARLHAVLAESGGAMLADDVGLGKTYTALATARHARALLIVAPAALRPMWDASLRQAHVAAAVVSFEALSRGATITCSPDFVIVDEAHHVRTVGTRRYGALAALCADAKTLLLTATPVHNRAGDLRAQLALFLGARAWSMPEAELARYVVKRGSDALAPADPLAPADAPARLPELDGVQWLDCGDDASLLDEILSLPSPLPAADAGDGGVLLSISLARQWASSRTALRSALVRRLARADGLAAALAEGRYPTSAELRAWHYAEGTLQLAFPGIVSAHTNPDADALREGVEAHRAAVAALVARTRTEADADQPRAMAIRDVAARHPGEVVIVFAEYAATVEALYARLAPRGGVARLTDRGGFVAGGRISRAELLEQLAPGPVRDRTPAGRRISMLITTDLLSEGVNLQEASVVVHADLPWSPARFEQRVGRVRRMGSRHARVSVYALKPPAPTETLLRLESRLRAKIAAAARTVGVSGSILPRLFAELPAERSHATQIDAMLSATLAAWRMPAAGGDDGHGDGAPVATIESPISGLLAAVRVGHRTMLIGDVGDGLTVASDVLFRIVRAADGVEGRADESRMGAAVERVGAWLARRETTAVVDLSATAAAPARRRLLRRVDAIIARSPRHLRAGLSPVARDARRAATTVVGAGAERVFQELAESRLPDAAWLTAVRTFAQLHSRESRGPGDEGKLIALLVLASPRAADRSAGPARGGVAAVGPP